MVRSLIHRITLVTSDVHRFRTTRVKIEIVQQTDRQALVLQQPRFRQMRQKIVIPPICSTKDQSFLPPTSFFCTPLFYFNFRHCLSFFKMAKPRGLNTARKQVSTRRDNRWVRIRSTQHTPSKLKQTG